LGQVIISPINRKSVCGGDAFLTQLPITNNNNPAPGNSPGKFTIAGNYTATGTAVHQVEIASADLYYTISIVSDPSFPSGNAAPFDQINIK
jgi:hypothetical protein